MLSIPGHCWLCKMPLTLPHWGFCSCCTASLPRPPVCCPCCGLPAGQADCLCGRCLQKPPPWQSMIFVSDYGPPLDKLIQRWKFHNTPALSEGLARLLFLRLQAQKYTTNWQLPDTILSVPLFQRRHWLRGFNQSDLLARPLAHWLKCVWEPAGLQRRIPTVTQHRLSARLRRHNLNNAFTLEIPVKQRHIAIVDDVVTTGSTAGEIARQLNKAGAASIQIWCLCRTL